METNFKIKTTKPSGGPSNHRKPPKYFNDFAKQMLDFVKEQRNFNKYVLDMFKKHKWIK